MSSSSTLYIGNYPIYSLTRWVNPKVMVLFRAQDKKSFERKFSQRSSLQWGHAFSECGNQIETGYEYSNTAYNIKQRLNIMGFTEERLKENLIKNVSEIIEEKKQNIKYHLANFSKERDYEQYAIDKINNEIIFFANVEYENWLAALKIIYEKKLTKTNLPTLSEKIEQKSLESLIEHLLEYGEIADTFPVSDIRYLVRAFVEVCLPDEMITQDFTDLVDAGWYDWNESHEELCAIDQCDFVSEKILILAEGSSDIDILRRSLKLLYPHLCDYYSFMDFHLPKAAGGAAALVNVLKSFIGAKIKNYKIIAIFDNDTAGEEALSLLRQVQIPENIKVLQYPILEFARKYPTHGPTGILEHDINGTACGIELYLGVDVLRNEEGDLTPVQWKGYNDKLKKYHGEIMRKNDMQSKFTFKLEKCEKGENLIGDWDAMHLILQAIFNAFN